MEYKDWITFAKPYATVKDELSDFNQYGRRYRYLLEGPTSDDDFSDFARRLKIWDVSTVYPLVIYLFEESGFDKDDLIFSLNDLESFIVRRLICSKMTKEYNIFFVEIVSKLRKERISRERLRELLLQGKGETREWPDDKAFTERWHNAPIYRNLSSQQLVTIMRMIEDRLRSVKSETLTIDQASVEHIMPQKWAANYKLEGESIEPDMTDDWYYSSDVKKAETWNRIKEKVQYRNKIIQTIGNLTIVTQPLNTALSNGPFDSKKTELLHSSLMLNHYFHNIAEWDEQSIVERAEYLFPYALKLWPHPMLQ